MKQSLFRNISYSFLGRFWSTALSLILTPFIISKIGVQEFGVYILMESIVVYFSFMDMGFSTSFDKFIAEYNAKKEYENILNVIIIGSLFYIFIALGILITAFGSKKFILKYFNFGQVPIEIVSFVYISLIVMLIIRCNSEIFGNAIKGLLRYDVLNKIRIVTTTLYFAGIVFFYPLDMDLRGWQ